MSLNISEVNPKENIIIKGAKLHNLKNIDVVIPRNKLVVITGLSGSGKSSLAFDTRITSYNVCYTKLLRVCFCNIAFGIF